MLWTLLHGHVSRRSSFPTFPRYFVSSFRLRVDVVLCILLRNDYAFLLGHAISLEELENGLYLKEAWRAASPRARRRHCGGPREVSGKAAFWQKRDRWCGRPGVVWRGDAVADSVPVYLGRLEGWKAVLVRGTRPSQAAHRTAATERHSDPASSGGFAIERRAIDWVTEDGRGGS